MKKLTNITRWICEHCKKEYKAPSCLPKHEKACKKNPANKIACIGCIFLKETKKDFDIDLSYGYTTIRVKSFHCEAKDVDMYPPKAVHKGLLNRYPGNFEDEELMPTKCSLHKWDESNW